MLRRAAVAGSFYPEDPAVLTAVIEDFLAEADGMAFERPLKAIIAPHAGYIYSGEIAARVYAAIVPWAERIRRVVLLGPAHYLPFTGIAVPAATDFETPLGPVPVDREALGAIGGLPQVVMTDEPHAPEHSLEVQIPFLQVVLGAIEIVPLVVGRARPGEVAEVLERLWGGGETLIVVSSDLSHYLDYELGPVPLPRLRDRAPARRQDRRRHRVPGRIPPGPGGRLRLPADRRAGADRQVPRHDRATARPAQLRRHRRAARRRGRLRRLGVRGSERVVPKVTDNDAFHGSGSGRPDRRGAQRAPYWRPKSPR